MPLLITFPMKQFQTPLTNVKIVQKFYKKKKKDIYINLENRLNLDNRTCIRVIKFLKDIEFLPKQGFEAWHGGGIKNPYARM